MNPVGIDRLSRNGPRRDLVTDVSLAREALAERRSALDLAVAGLPDVDGDEAMATPALLRLLLGAVRAKENLSRLEALLALDLGEAQ
jgi:hypothetical protein